MRGTPLGAEDAARLHMAVPENPMTITAALVLDRPLAREALVPLVEERFLRHPRFRWTIAEPRFGIGMPRWVEADRFELDDHLFAIDAAGSGGDDELERLASAVASRPLDPRRPPWRMHLVGGLDGGRASALVVVVSHALADGAALLGILEDLADERAAPRDGDGDEARARGSRMRGLLAGAVSAARLAARPADPRTPLRGRLGTDKRLAFSSALELEDLLAAGRALDLGIAGVLLAATCGALRSELGPRASRDPRLVIHALLPVNVPRETPHALGNRYGSILVPLAVGASGIDARVARVRDDLRRLRTHAAVNAGARIAAAAGVATATVERLGVAFYSRKASVMVSNVRGPSQGLHLAGAGVRDVVVWAPCPGSVALGITLMSYAGRVRLGVSADAAVVGDPHRIVRALELETAALSSFAASIRGHTGRT